MIREKIAEWKFDIDHPLLCVSDWPKGFYERDYLQWADSLLSLLSSLGMVVLDDAKPLPRIGQQKGSFADGAKWMATQMTDHDKFRRVLTIEEALKREEAR